MFIRFSQHENLLPMKIVFVLKQQSVYSLINPFDVYLFNDHILVMWEGAGWDILPRHSTCQTQFPESFDWPVQHRNNAAAKIWSFPFKEPEQFPLCHVSLTSSVFQISEFIWLEAAGFIWWLWCTFSVFSPSVLLLCSKLPNLAGLTGSVPVTVKIIVFSIQANIWDDSYGVQERGDILC